MARIDLKKLEAVGRAHRAKLDRCKGLLMVCNGTGCASTGGLAAGDELRRLLKKRRLDRKWRVVPTGCRGFCAMGPIVTVEPDGILYRKVDAKGLEKIVAEHLVGGTPVQSLMHKDPATGTPIPRAADIPFFAGQRLVALRNQGRVDPGSLDSAIAAGVYGALAKALREMTPADVLAEVKRSGLRGRGGAGFPTGLKWESSVEAAQRTGTPPVVVCNADETDPHTILEGMCLGAYAVGASEGLVYIRKEYVLALGRLEKAVAEARKRGLLGKRILGTTFSFDVRIHRRAGAFVCGESSALMASMEGGVAEPRAKYVHAAESGYEGRPTVLNNAETWANIAVIVEKGGAWFGATGTGDVSKSPWSGSSGTKVFTLAGAVHHNGRVEVPMGTTLRRLLFDVGGGIPGGRALKAVQIGGPSGACLPASRIDLPLDFDTLAEAGAMMGSGGVSVMDDRSCMVDVAKHFVDYLRDESCGKCTPCREGLTALSEILAGVARGEGGEEAIGRLEAIGATMRVASLCQLGGTASNPVLSTLQHFRDEYRAHLRDRKCPAGVCKDLIRFEITEACTGCMVCARSCPSKCITGEKKKLHVIDSNACIRCGVCRDVCKFDAVKVE